MPEDGTLPALELKTALERTSSLTVFLAVPVLHIGRANAASDGRTDGVRFLVHTQELEDENTGEQAQAIQVRTLNLRLMTSNQDLAGYEVLPIARLHRPAGQAEGCALDETYIPPVLACDAWKPLRSAVELARTFGARLQVLTVVREVEAILEAKTATLGYELIAADLESRIAAMIRRVEASRRGI